jgi:DNA adenine methylase
MIKSPLNYIGGKSKLLSQILPLLPKEIKTFIDLFAGGCNVGINVNAQKVIFNDNLNYLIVMYDYFMKTKIDEIILDVENKIDANSLSKTNVDGYNNLRSEYNTKRKPIDLFILICFSFNHQIRFNNKHEFNVPLGKERSSYNDSIKKNLIKFKSKLHEIDASFTKCDFTDFNFNTLNSNDFVYCDPPYLITTGSYNDGKRGFKGWTPKEELELLSRLDLLNNRGIKFALSNVIDHKGLVNEYLINWIDNNKSSLKVNYLNFNYKNSNYQTSNSKSTEVLITNYKPTTDQIKIF